MSKVPVTILTGFLGSGKTTLLNRALRDPNLKNTAVIVNEFGDIGLDHDLIEASSDSVVLLPNGCLCCSVRSDLVETLSSLYEKRQQSQIPAFDHVVIETSGLAEPTPVLEVLLSEPSVKARFAPAGIVATVDAVNGLATLDNHEQSVKQVAMANRIILTKCDLTDGQDEIRARLLDLNPGIEVLPTEGVDAGRLFKELLDETGEEGYGVLPADFSVRPAEGHGSHHHNARIKRFSVIRDQPWDLDTLRLLLDALATNAGPALLRVKGIINVKESPDHPAVVHGAQQLVHSLAWLAQWPSEDKRTRMVFITMDSDEGEILDLIDYIERLSSRTRSVRERARGA